jgi:hypothetical protein
MNIFAHSLVPRAVPSTSPVLARGHEIRSPPVPWLVRVPVLVAWTAMLSCEPLYPSEPCRSLEHTLEHTTSRTSPGRISSFLHPRVCFLPTFPILLALCADKVRCGNRPSHGEITTLVLYGKWGLPSFFLFPVRIALWVYVSLAIDICERYVTGRVRRPVCHLTRWHLPVQGFQCPTLLNLMGS